MLATVALVVYGHRRRPRKDNGMLDYLLMGRQLTLPLYVMTLTATWYGGIFGVTQIAFQHGIYSFLIQGLFWYATYILFALVFVKHVRKYSALTLPQLVTRMFGNKAGKLSSVFNFFNVLPIAYATSLGLLLQSITGMSFQLSVLVGVVAVACYSMYGGFRAIVYSDVMQFFLMYAAVISVIYFSYQTHGGLSFLQQALPTSHFSLTADVPLLTTFVWGFIALSTLVDPNFYQRIFAARSEQVARRGILIATLVWMVFDLCTVFGAMYARAVLSDHDASNAYLIYALQVLPSPWGGLLLAGICATILSTLDSYMLIASTTLSYDIGNYKSRIVPHATALAMTATITILLSYLFAGEIPHIWKTLGTYSAACLLFPVVCGFFLPAQAIKDTHFVCVCLASAVAVTVWRYLGWELDELYIGVGVSIIGIAFSYLAYKKNS